MEYTYLFLHSEDVDQFLSELKASGRNLKPKFKKFKFTEIFAVGDGITAGKYENVAFFLLERDIETSAEYIDKLKVVVERADDRFKDFRYGKYLVEEGEITTLKLDTLDTEVPEKLLLDTIPAMQILVSKTKIFLNQCSLQSESMSKEETKIIWKVSTLSRFANQSDDISELEKILSEVSNLHMSFFEKFARFKDVNEEIFLSIVKLETISREVGGWYEGKIQEFKGYHQSLLYFESKFEQTLNGVRDLFSIISLQLDAMRNRENIDLQKRTSSLQAAAAIIEFVAVFYYTLKIWDHFLPIEKMPAPLAFIILTSFAVAVVGYTEFLAEFVRHKKVTASLSIVTLLLVTLLFLMAALPLIF